MYVYRCPLCPAGRGIALREPAPCMPTCLEHTPPVEMRRVGEMEKALLPLDREPPYVAPGLVPLKVEQLKAAGILLPETQDALEWLYKQRHTNGMAEAFCKVGGRRCIDLVAFARLIRERRA